MFLQPRTKRNPVAKISSCEEESILSFIQGAVCCYCKNVDDEWFSGRILFGGVNGDWTGTPLQKLFDWHNANGSKDPDEMAGHDLGWLLLKVLDADKRVFEHKSGYTAEYRWLK